MKTKKIILFLILIFFTGCLFSFVVDNFKADNKNDMITINRIVQEVTNHWDSLEDVNNPEFIYPFCVLSLEDTVLYQSSPKAVHSINDAVANGDVILNIEHNNEIVGKVIVTVNKALAFRPLQKSLSRIIFLSFTAFTILCGIYFLYLQKKIIRPFQNLEEFAYEIANGNLDFILKTEKENIFGSFTQTFDIMREQLKNAKHQEFLANQSKKELVASLSHDIKTPVTSIKLTSELLMVTTEDMKIKDKLNIIYQKAEQINLLVTDLFHATLDDLEKLSVNPLEIYSSTLESMIREADCYDCITMMEIPDCILYADPIRLNQVIANIIYNSYKYADTPVDIRFAISNNCLEVYIQDYGTGVEKEELPLLFNKFYRGKNAATQSGSGLGLYICKKLIEQMEGEIYCSNNEKGFLTLLLLRLA